MSEENASGAKRRSLIVTGGSRGIGAQIAILGAAAGYAVAVNYVRDSDAALRVVERIRESGGTACAIQADIAVESEVERLFDLAERELGPVSALVSNAGVTGLRGNFVDADVGTLRRVIDVNLLGSMFCAQVAVRRMSRSRGGQGGAIVNISSVAATLGSPTEYVHYAASKAGVDALTIGLAKEVARDGIRVNAVSPGSTLTDIHATMGDPDRPKRVAGRIPMGRLAEPEEIARTTIWLLSDDASYVSGAILRVAGGL